MQTKGEKKEAQKGEVTCLRSQSSSMEEPWKAIVHPSMLRCGPHGLQLRLTAVVVSVDTVLVDLQNIEISKAFILIGCLKTAISFCEDGWDPEGTRYSV